MPLKNKNRQQLGSKQPPHKRAFLDGVGSYGNEYRFWIKFSPVKSLLGIFELEDCDYFNSSTQDLMPRFGFGACEQLFYKVDTNNESTSVDEDKDIFGGWASAVKDVHGKVRSIIFIRAGLPAFECREEPTPEAAAAVKLMVLLHELGHADDIHKCINYNHELHWMDILEESNNTCMAQTMRLAFQPKSSLKSTK